MAHVIMEIDMKITDIKFIEQIISEIINDAECLLFVKDAKDVNVERNVTFNDIPVVHEDLEHGDESDPSEMCDSNQDNEKAKENNFISDEEFLQRWAHRVVDLSQKLTDISLVKYWFKISKGRTNLRVFVPFSSSSADIQWLYNQGNQVVVIHAVRGAANALFDGLKMSYNVTRLNGSTGWRYSTHDQRLSIFVTSFWNISTQNMGLFDVVYDIEALKDLHKKHQSKYADLLKGLMKSGSFGIIKGLETYGLKTYEAGGAHCLSLGNIEKLFGQGCAVTCLDKKKVGSKLYQNTFNFQFQ